MDESFTQEILNVIEYKITLFEKEKSLEKQKNRNLGIIYTPKEIVDYIVSNIFRIHLEELLNNEKYFHQNLNLEGILLSITNDQMRRSNFAKRIKNIRILDPSCGSGRFLISIAENLYQIRRILNPNISEFVIKKEIIQNNLFGIEIENSAYNISKLRLLRWFLSTNIERIILNNTNSKISNFTNFDQIIEELDLKLNIYNLDFLLKFNSDNFDIIIGNPPYVENKKIKDVEFKKKLTSRYRTAYRLFDLSILFIERSLELLKYGGSLSFILPNKFLAADYGVKVRELLLDKSEIKEIINISSLPIFENIAIYPVILSLKKIKQNQNREIEIKILRSLGDLHNKDTIKTIKFRQDLINKFPSNVIPILGNIKLITYLYQNFKTIAKSFQDLKIIYRPYGFLKYSKYFENVSEERKSDKDLVLIGTGNIEKYFVKFNKRIKIAGKDIKISYFNYQSSFEPIWSVLNSEKLIFREIAKELTCCYDPGLFTNITGLYFIKIPSLSTDQLFSLLTILNSNLLDLVFKTLFGTLHMSGGYLRFNGSFIKRLPLPNKFPLFLSQLGKILHCLSQLKYDLDSKETKIVKNPEIVRFNYKNYNEIQIYLKFFKRLSNSMVNLLFLDEYYLDSNLDYYLLRNLFDLNTEPIKIPFKFLIRRFNVDNYEIFSLNELDSILTKIKKLYSRLYDNTDLINQIDELMKNKFNLN